MNEIHPTAVVSPLADLEISVRGSCIRVGPEVRIDSFVKMKFAGGLGDIVLGAGCYINSGTVIYSGHGVTLGANVLVAANCTLSATNHAFADRNRPIRDQGFMVSRGGITIEDDVWVGANCTLLDGTVVRRGAVIAAGAVLRSEVPTFAIVAGSPARQIGSRGA